MPLVSVIMASYNHEKYVGRAIQSVLDQTLPDWELVIIDDGSRDGTVAQIEKFTDARIRFFRFARNRGQFVATNHGLRETAGKYVAVLNSDDMFLPAKLEEQVGFLDSHPEVGAVFSRVRMVDERDQVLPGNRMFLSENRSRFAWLNWFFYRGNCLCHPAVLIRRQCHEEIGDYDERYAQMADYDLWVRLCMKYEIHVLPQELAAFRVLPRAANMSGKRPDSIRRSWWEQRRILDNFLFLDSPAFLLAVFPEAEPYADRLTEELVPFVLAQLALQARHGRKIRQAFALETIFRLLGNRQTAAALSERFGFEYKDFIRLTGQCDVFNAATVRQMRAERQRRRGLWSRVLRGIGKC